LGSLPAASEVQGGEPDVRVEIYGERFSSDVAEFKERLAVLCSRVGVTLNWGRNDVPKSADKRRVAVVFAAKNAVWTDQEDARFKHLIKSGAGILPVIADAPTAKYLPQTLSPFNAFLRKSYGIAWPDCLADEVLSMAWLRRRTPKVFISYKRSDSAPIAAQLYDQLNRLGYDTFFDEATIERGADFQRELKWWLNDADLLIVLASPRFPDSKWCMEEVTFCQQRFIGIAAVEWPDEIYSEGARLKFPAVRRNKKKPVVLGATMPDQGLKLRPRDFAGMGATWAKDRNPDLPSRPLTRNALARVLAACARQRTVAIRQRLEDLIPLARSVLPVKGAVKNASSFGDLIVGDRGGKGSFVRVLPFRPRPEDLRQTCGDAVGYGEAGCLYAENDPYDSRAEAIRWLANGRRASGAMSKSFVWACCGGLIL
jgi:hypothetical protein